MDSRDKTCAQRPTGVHRWVVNDKPRAQENVLILGPNFIPAPTKLPLIDTVVAMEEEARQLADKDLEDLWG